MSRDAVFQQARSLATAGRYEEADALVRRSAPKPGRDAEGLRVRGMLAILASRPGEARTLLEKSLRVAESVEAHLLLAEYHMRMVDNDAAIESCRAAVRLDPGDPRARIQACATLVELSRVDEAAAIIEPIATKPPADPALARSVAISVAAVEVQQRRYQEAIDRLQEILANDPPEIERRNVLDLLAKALDRVGRTDEAFEAAANRNAMVSRPVDPARILADADAFIAANDRSSLEAMPRGIDDPRPVFIAGMPRSGTSLVDRIIDAHPMAAGVGERPVLERAAAALRSPNGRPPSPESWSRLAERTLADLAEAAPPSAIRIVDKSLANDRLLGLAARLLPGARVLHVIRDPRDVAVSCHLGQFNVAKHPWTTSLAGTAAAWEASRRIMAHWRETIDLPILEVRYERLVRDPDHEFPRIVEFLGLEWDEACRRFHESGRPLRTLSFDQVSRPIYTTSVGRHEAFARHLESVAWPEYDPEA